MKLILMFKKIFIFFLVVIAFVLSLYFFVFPSIIGSDINDKNILIVSSKLESNSNYIYLAHISGNNEKNDLFIINSQNNIEVPRGYGQYPLQSVYQLLRIDKKDDQFIKSVFSEIFKISIDEIVTLNTELSDLPDKSIPTFFLKNSFDSFQTLSLHYKSKYMDFSHLNSIEDITGYYQDLSTIYGDLHQYCSVAVVNATQQNGLAGKVGKIIENTGGLVIRLDDLELKSEKTKIYVGQDPLDCSRLAKSISGIFIKNPEIKLLSELKDAQQYRANVVVIIGE